MEEQQRRNPQRRSDEPALQLRYHDDETVAELFEPNADDAYILVDKHSLIHLGESL